LGGKRHLKGGEVLPDTGFDMRFVIVFIRQTDNAPGNNAFSAN
jgi:hypothetical protein